MKAHMAEKGSLSMTKQANIDTAQPIGDNICESIQQLWVAIFMVKGNLVS